jgi:hypothetical protein
MKSESTSVNRHKRHPALVHSVISVNCTKLSAGNY